MRKQIMSISLNSLLATLSIIFLSSFNSAWAAGGSTQAPETLKMAESLGDPDAGQAKAAVCGACHGADGNSNIAMNPKLAGQSDRYIFKQLMDFKSGARANVIMAGQVAGLSEQDMKDIASYYAQQEASQGAVKKDLFDLGQQIYRAGNPETGLPACIACHGPAGKGMASAGFPSLAGQHAQYTGEQLAAFRAAGRGDRGSVTKRMNDSLEGSLGMMQSIAAKMTDDEIEAVSSYVSGLR